MSISRSSRLVLVSVLFAAALVAIAVQQESAAPRGVVSISSAAPRPTIDAGPPAFAPNVTLTSAPSSGTPPPVATIDPAPGNSASGTQSLTAMIASLPVADEHREGYRRDLFRLWIDDDGNGCNTRQEVLIAEAVVPPRIGSGCRLSGGQWVSPYDAIVVTNASALDIDHLVPLAEAWDSGASAWTAQQREAYANELDVPWALVAVTAASNRGKGDRDPAQWMPPLASAACTYVVDWVAVKTLWHLAVDPAERQALEGLAAECSQTPVPPIPPNGNLP